MPPFKLDTAEVSPYAVDLNWSGIDDPEEIAAVVADPGRATTTMHASADDSSGHSLVPFSTEPAIDAAAIAAEDGFGDLLVDFAYACAVRVRRTGTGRPPDLRGSVP